MIIPCRFSFVNVFEPKEDLSGNPKYSAQLLIDKSDTKAIEMVRAGIDDAVQKGIERGKITRQMAASAKFKKPLRDGDDPENETNMAAKGCYFLNASNKAQPGVVNKHCQPILNIDEFYSGCYGLADVQFFAFNTSGNCGIGVSLQNVMKKRDGERLDGRQSAEQAFKAFAEPEEGAANTGDDDELQ